MTAGSLGGWGTGWGWDYSSFFVPSDIPQAEADALIWLYNQTNGDSWTDKTGWKTDPVVNNWYGLTVTAGQVVTIALANNNLSGNIANLDVSALTALSWLELRTNASLSGDISGIVVPTSLKYLLFGSNPLLTGDIGLWSSWLHTLTGLLYVYVYTTGCVGSMNTWVLPASLQYLHTYSSPGITGVPTYPASCAIRSLRHHQSQWTQSNVDNYISQIYTNRAQFTWSAPELQIGGNNAAPSGTYQLTNPPVTGLEQVYWLCNDPLGEGFNTWTISWNGGSAP